MIRTLPDYHEARRAWQVGMAKMPSGALRQSCILLREIRAIGCAMGHNRAAMQIGGNLVGWIFEEATTRGRGDHVALRQGPREVSYHALHAMVAGLADALAHHDFAPGDTVVIGARDTIESVAALLAVMYAGGIAVPLSELATPSDLAQQIAHVRAKYAIVDDSVAGGLAQVRAELPFLAWTFGLLEGGKLRVGLEDDVAIPSTGATLQPVQSIANAPVVLLFSASSEVHGLRAIAHSRATISAAYMSCGQGLIEYTPSDVVLSTARMSTAFGLGVGLFFPLMAGATCQLFPEQPRSEAMLRVIAEVRPTVLVATPTVFGQLALDLGADGPLLSLSGVTPAALSTDTRKQIGAQPLAGLRVAVAGAEAMPEALIPRIRNVLGTELLVGYGLTEICQFALAGKTEVVATHWGVGCVPLSGVDVRVVDDDGDPTEPDQIGTLQLRAASLCEGYWPLAEDTRFASDEWFTTSDRFLIDGRGRYHHCGRVDDLFKVGGKWVAPEEVERALVSHEAVWESAVIGYEDESGLIKPLAFVVPNVGRSGSPALENELKEYIKHVLAPYKYPRWIEFVDALPRGPNGKILRFKLRPRRRRRGSTGALR